jgi:hypothetical protein
VTPGASGTDTYTLTCSDSGASAGNSAKLQVNAPSLTILGVSNSSPLPLTPIQIMTSGLNVAAPIVIQFSDATGYSVTETPIRIASDGSTVIAAVPLYVSVSTQQIGPGTVSVVLTQGDTTTSSVTVAIQDLPSVSSYGVQPGQITHAFLVMEAMLIGRRLNLFQAFQVASGNTVDTTSAQSHLSALLNATIQARSDVDRVTLDSTVVVPAGTLPDGNSIQFDSTTLDLMDRIHGIFLTGAFGTILGNPSSSGMKKKGINARVRDRRGRFTFSGVTPQLDKWQHSSKAYLSPTFVRGKVVGHPESGVPPLNYASLLGAMEGVNNLTDITKATQTLTNPQNIADTVAAIGQGAGAVNSIIADNTKFGVVATFVSTVNISAHCWGDVLYWVYDEATGDQAGAAAAVQDMQSIPLKEELQAVQNLALAPFESLQAVSTVLNFVENVASYTSPDSAGNSSVNNDYQTQLSIVTSDSSVASSATQGLAEIEGNVDVTTNLGLEAPESGIDVMPGPSGETITTIADPSGYYDILVPLGVAGFDYATSQFTITDPISAITSGSELINLSGASTTLVLQIPTMTGSCNDDDAGAPDADDPDCD